MENTSEISTIDDNPLLTMFEQGIKKRKKHEATSPTTPSVIDLTGRDDINHCRPREEPISDQIRAGSHTIETIAPEEYYARNDSNENGSVKKKGKMSKVFDLALKTADTLVNTTNTVVKGANVLLDTAEKTAPLVNAASDVFSVYAQRQNGRTTQQSHHTTVRHNTNTNTDKNKSDSKNDKKDSKNKNDSSKDDKNVARSTIKNDRQPEKTNVEKDKRKTSPISQSLLSSTTNNDIRGEGKDVFTLYVEKYGLPTLQPLPPIMTSPGSDNKSDTTTEIPIVDKDNEKDNEKDKKNKKKKKMVKTKSNSTGRNHIRPIVSNGDIKPGAISVGKIKDKNENDGLMIGSSISMQRGLVPIAAAMAVTISECMIILLEANKYMKPIAEIATANLMAEAANVSPSFFAKVSALMQPIVQAVNAKRRLMAFQRQFPGDSDDISTVYGTELSPIALAALKSNAQVKYEKVEMPDTSGTSDLQRLSRRAKELQEANFNEAIMPQATIGNKIQSLLTTPSINLSVPEDQGRRTNVNEQGGGKGGRDEKKEQERGEEEEEGDDDGDDNNSRNNKYRQKQRGKEEKQERRSILTMPPLEPIDYTTQESDNEDQDYSYGISPGNDNTSMDGSHLMQNNEGGVIPQSRYSPFESSDRDANEYGMDIGEDGEGVYGEDDDSFYSNEIDMEGYEREYRDNAN